MLVTCIGLVLSILFGLARCQGQDLTTQEGTNGSAVVSACISRVRESGIFTSDNEMLLRIAYVETDFGNNVSTYRADYHGGIWAVDEDLFDETQNTASHSSLTSLHQSIQSTFSIEWSSVEWRDLRKPLYSALAARLYFYTVSASIPISSNVQTQATYWVTHYNPSGSTSTFVTLVNQLLAMDECSVSGIDIYFLMDESGSVGASNYGLMKQFVNDTVNEFDIGPDDTQVGVISYSSSAVGQFYLNTYHEKSSLLTAINYLPYSGGNTNTAAAIDLLHQSGFTSTNGGRPESQAIPRVGVVITDGYSSSYSATVAAAQSAHDNGITLFAIGIGSNVNSDELDAIASDPSYVSTITGFDSSQFDALQTTITNEACTTSAEVEINETVDTSVGEDEITYIKVPYDSDEGVTIKINVTNGTVTVYVSDQTTTPNEAFYDWMIETDGYSDVYLDPDAVNRTIGDTVYIAIEGQEPDNDFTLVTEEGDTTSAPDAPVNVTIGTVTATTVAVSWTAPMSSNRIIRYNIEVSEEEFGLSPVKVNTIGTSVTVTGLEEYNTYGCKVAAVTNSQAGEFSPFVNFTTLEAAPSAAPQSASGKALSPSTITLNWDPPPAVDINGEIEYYVVEVEEIYTGRMWTFHAVDDHINIASLHAYYVYQCRIAAFTTELGPFTSYYDVYSGEKAPTAAPENVTVVDDSPSSVNLTWDSPPYEMQNGRIREYNIELTEVETGDVLKFTSSYTNITIEDLLPFYNYTCTISAETVGEGPSSDEITFVLPEGHPDGPPQNVSGSATSSTSIEVTWDPPTRHLQNGYVVEYRVTERETDTGTVSRWTVTDTSLTVTSLHPYYEYTYSIAAVTVGIGPYSTAISITTDEAAPTAAPQNFTSSVISAFEVALFWSPPVVDKQNGVITDYVINVTEDDTGDQFQVFTSNTSVTVGDNLRPYDMYTCVIAAETSAGLGPFSSSISFTTDEYVPSEPSISVSRREGEPNELLVTWTAPDSPNGVILNYTVYCNDSDSVLVTTVSWSERSTVVVDLTPFTYYDCYVTANTSVGEGDKSTVKNAQTDESEPGDAPTDFLSTVVNSTAVKLTWNEPLLPYGVLISYNITYNTSDSNISRFEYATDPREVVIGGLEEHTRYRFEIFASTRIGRGPAVSLITRTDISEPHSPPTSISYEVDSSTEVTLSWEPPPFEDRNGPITYYSLILTELVFDLGETYTNVTSLSYTLTDLEEYNNYSFVIAAATEKGLGPYSMPYNFTTDEDNPSSAPSNVTGDVRSSTLVVFTWIAPPAIDQNGVITYYVVRVLEIETDALWTFFVVDEDINIGSLHPYYHYDCTVAASTTAGAGPRSTAIRVQMEEAAPSGPPLSLTSQKTSRSLTLSWDPPTNETQNGVIQQYRIRIVEEDTSTTTMYTSKVTTISVTSLHPYYTYKCSVAAETVDIGPYTSVLTLQLDEDSPSSSPVNFTGLSLSSTSISLSWSPPPLEHRNGIIRSYAINSTELETNNTFSYTSVSTNLRINSLHPYYQYQFIVTAVTIGSGPPSSSITVRTKEDAPSSPAQNSSVESITATSISLTWDPPAEDQRNGIIILYVIRVVSVKGRMTSYYNSSVSSVTLTSLKPYTTYECSISAETSAGRGPYSNAISVRTDEAAPSSPPQNLTGTSMSSDIITLSWSPPPASDTNGVIREYRVNIREVETGTVFSLTTTATTITLQSLHPYYTYLCTVSAYTVGVGPYTAVFSIRTPEDVPSGYPQSFSAIATSSRSAVLTWDPPNAEERNGIVVEYIINVSAVETGENFQLTSTTTSITVASLRPYTTYRCIIAASTSVGIGPFSTVFTLVTPEDVPTSAPTYPSGYALSARSIYLSWYPPPVLERHGIIRQYRINVTEQETGELTTYTTSSTFIELALLHPFYTYVWTVAAVTISPGPYTTSGSVTTYQDVPSGPPLNFFASEVFSRSFTLTWDLPDPSQRNGLITGYNISITSLDSLFEDPQEFFTESRYLTVDSLNPHTDYICIIAANTYVGIGPFSLEITVRTEQDVPGAPPSNTTGMALNSTHVHLTWDPPPADQINGVIQGYRINITELDTGEVSQHIVVDNEAIIGPLHPHYNYNFSIVAFTHVGHGPTTFVVIRTAEAAPSSAPEGFQAAAIDPTSISLSWTPPPVEDQNGIIRHYEVTLVALETGEIHIRTSVALTLTITSLRPYTTYHCTVAAETVATGPSTVGILTRTLQSGMYVCVYTVLYFY
jgi:receptor-type tyrosine-protein phosphatase Q